MKTNSPVSRVSKRLFKSSGSLRGLRYFPGIDGSVVSISSSRSDPSGPGTATGLSRYLNRAILAGGHGLSTGASQDGDWVQGTATQFFHAFTIIAREMGLPLIFKNPKSLGELLARAAEALEGLGWRRAGAVRTVQGYREHRFTRLGAPESDKEQ